MATVPRSRGEHWMAECGRSGLQEQRQNATHHSIFVPTYGLALITVLENIFHVSVSAGRCNHRQFPSRGVYHRTNHVSQRMASVRPMDSERDLADLELRFTVQRRTKDRGQTVCRSKSYATSAVNEIVLGQTRDLPNYNSSVMTHVCR